MKKSVLALALTLALLCALLVMPANALTAYDAVNTFETFLTTQRPAPPDDYYTDYAGSFYVDFDQNGMPELVVVYCHDHVVGEADLRVYYIDPNGAVKKAANGERSSSFGGSGGISVFLCRRGDGTFYLHQEEKYYGGGDSTMLGYNGAGTFVNAAGGGDIVFFLDMGAGRTVPGKFDFFPQPEQPRRVAYASTQTILMDGKAVEFQMYALKDANGFDTNYVKLRDVAAALDGTSAQFDVSWNGAVSISTRTPYTSRNGQENNTPYSGNQNYEPTSAPTLVDGVSVTLDAFTITGPDGGASTYYKLRDLGSALGFTVDWTKEHGVSVQTTQGFDVTTLLLTTDDRPESYPGLEIAWYYGSRDTFTITQPGYSVCGLQVGDSEAAARAFAKDKSTCSVGGYDLNIHPFPGGRGRFGEENYYLYFTFQDGKIATMRFGADPYGDVAEVTYHDAAGNRYTVDEYGELYDANGHYVGERGVDYEADETGLVRFLH